MTSHLSARRAQAYGAQACLVRRRNRSLRLSVRAGSSATIGALFEHSQVRMTAFSRLRRWAGCRASLIWLLLAYACTPWAQALQPLAQSIEVPYCTASIAPVQSASHLPTLGATVTHGQTHALLIFALDGGLAVQSLQAAFGRNPQPQLALPQSQAPLRAASTSPRSESLGSMRPRPRAPPRLSQAV